MKTYVSLKTQYENLGDQLIGGLLTVELARRAPVVALTSGVPDWYLGQFKASLGAFAAQVRFEPSAAGFGMALAASVVTGQESVLFLSPGDIPNAANPLRANGFNLMGAVYPRLRIGQVGASYAAVSGGLAGMLKRAGKGGALSVRDTRSQAVLAAAGIDVPVVPDLAFLLPYRRPADGRKAVLNFRVPKGGTSEALIERLRPMVEMLRAENFELASTHQVGRDGQLARQIAETFAIEFIDWPDGRPTLAQAKALYDETAVVLSNRLHALLLAASRGALPLAALPHTEIKVRGVFEDAGLGAFLSPDGASDSDWLRAELAERDTGVWKVEAAFATQSAKLRQYFDHVARGSQAALGEVA